MNSTYTIPEQEFLKEVGRRIREARQNLGQSQETFAKTCKLDRTYISDIERGERNISLLNLSKISTALKVQVSELIP